MKKGILSLAAAASRVLPGKSLRAIYGMKPLARAIRKILNRAAPQGLAQVSIAAGALAGVQMKLNLQTEKDYWLGTYEPDLQSAVGEFVKPGMVIYDVGANIGYVSLMLARAVGVEGKVYSFEALPANIQRLEENIALNGFGSSAPASLGSGKDSSGRISVVPGAVSSSADPVRFFVHSSGSMGKAAGSAGRGEEHYLGEIEVPGIVLDEYTFLAHLKPDLIKMDIEGGEVLAFQGMGRVLQEIHPVMFIELHGPEAAKCVTAALRSAGYTLRRMIEGYPILENDNDLDWKSYIIAV